MPYEEVQAHEEVQDPLLFDRPIYDESITIPLNTLGELPGHDPVEEALHGAGVRGVPVAAYTVGAQECVIVDVSTMPLEEDGRRNMFMEEHGPITGFGRIPDPGDGLPTLAIVHLRNRGRDGVDVRPLIPTQPVLYGRDRQWIAEEDPMGTIGFDYGTDASVSRRHASVLLDLETRSLTITDMGSKNKTPLRYMSRPTSEEAQTVREGTEEPSQVQVEVSVEIPEVQAMTGFTRTMGDKLADVLSRGTLTTDELDFVEAVTDGGSRIANGLVGEGMNLPESDAWSHTNMERMIEAAKIAINNNGDARTIGELGDRLRRDSSLEGELSWLFGVMSMVPGGRLTRRDSDSAWSAAQDMGVYARHLLLFMEDMAVNNGQVPISQGYLVEKSAPMMRAYEKV